MQTQVTKRIDFKDRDLFIGLDVHKKSWSVTNVVDGMEHRTFTQPPDPGALNNYLQRMFPGDSYNSAYEAGFCGYGIHRELKSLGINNIVINAADTPTSQKDKLHKRDPTDSRKIAKELEKGSLRGISIFDLELEELRSLNRTRFYMMRYLRRNKDRIKSFPMYYRVPIPPEFDNNQWTLKFISWLKQVRMKTDGGQDAFSHHIESYEHHRQQLLILSRIVRLRISHYDKELFALLKTISGIGPLTASALITEIGDINRFTHINHLGSYVGLIPRVLESGETTHTGWITFRCNTFLRTLLIGSSWQTKLIAASLRNYNQLELLAGTDVYTMPPKVAAAGRKSLNGKFLSRTHENYDVSLYPSAKDAHIEKFWEVGDKVLNLAQRLNTKLPSTGVELIHIAHEEGCEDMFPMLSREEKTVLAEDGKIPVFSRWQQKIRDGKIAPDTLLTLAGLASFTADQAVLDQRILNIIG